MAARLTESLAEKSQIQQVELSSMTYVDFKEVLSGVDDEIDSMPDAFSAERLEPLPSIDCGQTVAMLT